MPILTETELWKKSLGASCDGAEAEEFRQILIAALRAMEGRAATLGGEIARDLPEFPPHDASHSTAVWGLVDRIAGSNLTLTPVETFVLGAAVLLHDLGMAAAAYVEGPGELRREPRWSDTVASTLRQQSGEAPSAEQMTDLDEQTLEIVHQRILRELHAEQAEKLATARWQDHKGNEYALLESPEIREALGPLIGEIAHSHWASVGQLNGIFPNDIGAPPKAPPDWTIRPLVLACLLRLADGSHLDGSRAPRFLRLLRAPEGEAATHWSFQEHLAQPLQKEDRFVFSGTSFAATEAEAWWLCAETLSSLDHEFRSVDSLLADQGLPRLAIRGVVGADDISILAMHVPTDGWTPIDAKVRVSNVVRLVERLGGRELYGSKPEVPLRELIQNGMDSVRGRREVDHLAADWGRVTVDVAKEAGDRYWLEVEDSGLGMSPEVLTNHLLDFGTSFWESEQVVEEFPGLLSSSFEPVGKFGIGFFSVFMWGDDVDVISRRHDAARDETHILEFRGGVGKQPLLRRASPDEQLQEPGTRVKVLIDAEMVWRLGLDPEQLSHDDLVQLCGWIAPASDVDIYAGASSLAVKTGDWMEMPLDQLGERIAHSPLRSNDVYPPPEDDDETEVELPPEITKRQEEREAREEAERKEKAARIREHARTLYDEKGRPIGRLAVGEVDNLGAVGVIGGLRADSLGGAVGVLKAKPTTASRNFGWLVVSPDELGRWATEQARLVKEVRPSEGLELASMIWRCGGDPCELPIAETSAGPMSFEQIEEWASERSEIKIVQDAAFSNAQYDQGPIQMAEDVVAVDKTGGLFNGPTRLAVDETYGQGVGGRRAMVEALAEAVAAVWGMSALDLIAKEQHWTRSVVGRREGVDVELDVAVWERHGES